jgi:hypothetical protein
MEDDRFIERADTLERKNGETYLRSLGEAERPDLQRRVHDLVVKLQPRIAEVDRDFAERYGWTVREGINADFRRSGGPTPPLNAG